MPKIILPDDPEPIRRLLMDRVEVVGDCWVWKGLTHNGYGVLSIPNVRPQVRAHRLSYTLHVGPIPSGLVLDHICRNRGCVRPDHLEAVTDRENVLRGIGPTARNFRKTHCSQGHAYTPENTKWTKDGYRRCRACYRLMVVCSICGRPGNFSNVARHNRLVHSAALSPEAER